MGPPFTSELHLQPHCLPLASSLPANLSFLDPTYLPEYVTLPLTSDL